MDVLTAFWNAAATPTPIMIVGGGRWARVWLSVICSARGNADDVVMVARTNPDDLHSWLKSQRQFRHVAVVTRLSEAAKIQPTTTAAIVASRPRDHLQDGLRALEHDLHLLVEKPLTDRASDGVTLIEAAERRGRVLLPGTEFAFLPVLHEYAAQLRVHRAGVQSIRLQWSDPVGELRHGAVKSRHEEVGMLADILPHAVSIFGVFAPLSDFHIVQANQDESGSSAMIVLGDKDGRHYELRCSQNDHTRKRQLNILAAGTEAIIDFTSTIPSFTADGVIQSPSFATMAMPSTLRLQLGAFLSQIISGDRTAFIPHASRLVTLQQQLESYLVQQ